MNNLDVESIYLQYLGLGESRTIAKLSTLTGRSKDSLYKLAQRHKWAERLEKDSRTLRESFSLSDIQKMGAGELLAVINRKTLDKLAFAVHTLEPKNIRDAKVLLEIHSLISLKPTAITQETSLDDTGFMDIFQIIREKLGEKVADDVFFAVAEYCGEQGIESQ